jgi:signal peptidase I
VTAEAAAVVMTAAHPKSLVRDYVETILVCVIFVIFSRAFVFQQSKIPSGSMEDTLLVGDYIMVNRFVYAPLQFDWERKIFPTREIKRGDIVVFRQPDTPEVDYIKRVVGLPGDVVEVRRGYLYVNGEVVDEPYVNARYRVHSGYQRPTEVEPDHYFVLGDHRNSSSDSRVWGHVHADLIKGRALLIWWSFEERGDTSAYPTLAHRVRAWGDKARHFFTRTRWERCLSLIR